MLQMDALRCRATNSTGLPANELPSLRPDFKRRLVTSSLSWLLLIWLLFFLRREAIAPFYALRALLW